MATDPVPREVRFVSNEVELAGSMAVPDRGEVAHGVVMVGGSGASDRDNGTYFPPLRRHLVEAGIAVLSYDKRGVGSSTGDWRDATMDDLAGDALAALRFLRAQPGMRTGEVGLFGHSEGGWVVLRAAARAGAPWVITNSCPGMTPAAQDRHALANALRRGAATARPADGVLAWYDRLVDAGRKDLGFAEVAPLFDEEHAFTGFWGDMDERLWEFQKRKQDHDPVPDTLRLRCPHLAIFGGADALVPVADHRLQTNGGTSTAPGYLDTLTRWIKG
ncbi:alpha/beta hydrolase [Nonomuraea sp. NPDC005692]|uniref:alpha/beta hydrolase family protein n=1 Tax=Nonomuraea sp. NPDC005692 TaxID=3157168 RepID=UPI0033C6ABA3